MPSAKPGGRARQFSDLEARPAKDYDPEADVPSDSDSAADSEDSADEKAATEHYVNVGESKLRRKDPVALGSQYRGARVSRADLEVEDDDEDDEEEESGDEPSDNFEDAREDLDGISSEYDDPENADLEADRNDDEDGEIDSDNALGESDEEKFKGFTFRGSSQTLPHRGKRVTRPTAADFMGSDEEEEGESGEDDLEDEEEEEGESDEDVDSEYGLRNGPASAFLDDEAEESEDEEDHEDEELDGLEYGNGLGGADEGEDEGNEENEEDDGESDDEQRDRAKGDANRASLLDMVQAGQRSVAESLSSAAQKDVAKGLSVRQQQKAFDALLNIRIRMQKSLVAINSLNTLEEAEHQSEPYEAAEAAALKLWNAIEGFRSSIQSGAAAQSGQKRKCTVDATSSSKEIWESMQDTEKQAKIRRKAVLENWSQKAKNMRAVDKSSRKFSGSVEKPLTVRLEEELEAPERLIKRTRTPRSCAPAQVAKKANEDPSIYDDADFYQLLLKELVDQRAADTSGGAGSAAMIRFTAVKEAKAKRHVDTKASKGRKMRFNVHEKLQNFMAPEDRRTWEESAIDRLFGSLFGQKMELDEEAVSDQEMGGISVEEDGLRLFRS
ncbi:hypothetical protein DL766_000353 [Monosporascus sp. MC13-8B]|nr:hypothetical protein DL763_001118 [Monosporascus cannonballus]RYP39531.1 hypothetical protein DL766_000353 [Monosporascus sp. MC13-8B]